MAWWGTGAKTSSVQADSDMKFVAELIDWATGKSNEGLVIETLNPLDAESAPRLARPWNGGAGF
jgi:hypothetical protein